METTAAFEPSMEEFAGEPTQKEVSGGTECSPAMGYLRFESEDSLI